MRSNIGALEAYVAEEETMIFLHIPKTAGISLAMALMRQFPPEAIYQLRHGDNPVLARHHGSEDAFRALPEAERARYRLVFGHFKFGLHEGLPCRSSYITLLRDPVERTLSNFAHFNREREVLRGQSPLSFDEFCKAKPSLFDNAQTRVVCGRDFNRQPAADSLAQAKENLLRWFRVAGTTERLEETILILEKALGWSGLPSYRKNVSPRRSRSAEVDPRITTRIREQNHLDQELYGFANQRLNQAIGDLDARAFAGELDERRRRARAPYRVLGQKLKELARGALDRVRMALRSGG